MLFRTLLARFVRATALLPWLARLIRARTRRRLLRTSRLKRLARLAIAAARLPLVMRALVRGVVLVVTVGDLAAAVLTTTVLAASTFGTR